MTINLINRAVREEIVGLEKRLKTLRKIIGFNGGEKPAKRHTVKAVVAKATPKKRKMSAEARKRIADAQHKRWAKIRKEEKK